MLKKIAPFGQMLKIGQRCSFESEKRKSATATERLWFRDVMFSEVRQLYNCANASIVAENKQSSKVNKSMHHTLPKPRGYYLNHSHKLTNGASKENCSKQRQATYRFRQF